MLFSLGWWSLRVQISKQQFLALKNFIDSNGVKILVEVEVTPGKERESEGHAETRGSS